MFFFFFFFQAEDGIRDLYVTGVQTCALPICGTRWSSPGSSAPRWPGSRSPSPGRGSSSGTTSSSETSRSEEHTSELQSRRDLVCRLLLEKKKKKQNHLV